MPEKLPDFNKIVVAGAGTMGAGIAQVCAMAGYPTYLFDIAEERLRKARDTIRKNLDKGIEKKKVTPEEKNKALDNLSTLGKIKQVRGDLIIEAIVEDLALKQELLSGIESNNSDQAIIATNTSSIPVTQIAAGLARPDRFIGIHFFNPAHIMKLVEIISGVETDQAVLSSIGSFVKSIGKVPVYVKDSPGFIVNRVARHYYLESLKLAEEQVAGIENIDDLLEASGFRMGPFRLMDLIGIDTNYAVTESMYKAFNHEPRFRPSRLQFQKMIAGHHGRKSGRGFYRY